jgi:Na+/proline symporter
VLLFGVLPISLKKIAPSAHAVCEIVNARWERNAHKIFLFFCFAANTVMTLMLLLGGAATVVEALTSVDLRLASFLVPWDVILCVAAKPSFAARGHIIGSAIASLWNMMTWKKASGLILALVGWLSAAQGQSGKITVAALGTNGVMLSGDLIATISSAVIHWTCSTFVDPQDHDFSELKKHVALVKQDMCGLGEEDQDPVALTGAKQ